MTRRLGVLFIGALFTTAAMAAAGAPAYGQTTQTPPAEAKPEETKEEKPKTLWEETVLFSYIENSIVWNTGNASRGSANHKVFAIPAPGYVPTGKTQDTITFDFYYLFF